MNSDYPLIPPRKVKWVKCVDEELLKKEKPSETDFLRISVLDPEKTKSPFKRGLPLKKEYEYKPYQIEVLKWACQRSRGYLSLQMGLGKTLLGISIPACDNRSVMPALIVCPLNVLDEWVTNGFKKFFGTFYRYYVLHPTWEKKQEGKPRIKDICYEDLKNYDYIISTYDTVISSSKKREASKWYEMVDEWGKTGLGPVTDAHLDHREKGVSLIHSVKWSHLILDEVHVCSRHTTITAQACYKISAYKRWGLSGTKVRNNLEELWFQLKILHLPFSDVPYKRKKVEDIRKVYENKSHYIYEANYQVAKVVLPKLNRNIINLTLDNDHVKIYQTILGELKSALNDFSAHKVKFSHVLEKFLRLRQISVSPKILNPSYPLGNKIIKMVEFLKKTPEKTIVMSSFVTGLDILAEELKKAGISYSVFTGKVPIQKRTSIIQEFKEETKVLLANYKVAGVGLNLQFATQWISLEPWWNESIHRQGYQRIWRPGQTKPCDIFFYVFPGIEAAIMKMAGEKNDIAIGAEGKETNFRKITMDRFMIRRLVYSSNLKI